MPDSCKFRCFLFSEKVAYSLSLVAFSVVKPNERLFIILPSEITHKLNPSFSTFDPVALYLCTYYFQYINVLLALSMFVGCGINLYLLTSGESSD